MYQYSVLQWALCFYIYCFLGWCWETAYVSIKEHHFVNRGFMRGPFLPIYGSGAVIMLVVSQPFYENIGLTYIAGLVGATLLELITGIVMEMLFKVRYWDYSTKKFNFKGYICLSSSLVWGVFTVLMTRFLHKPVDQFLFWLPFRALAPITAGLTFLIAADFIQSFIGAINLRRALETMEKARGELAVLQRRLDAAIAFYELPPEPGSLSYSLEERAATAAEKLEELKDRLTPKNIPANLLEEFRQKNPSQEMLDELRKKINEGKERLRVYDESRKKQHRKRILGNPTMVSNKYKEAFEEFKQFIQDNTKK